MLLNTESKISDIVRNDYRTADVFKKHGINYCCGGQVSLLEVCALRNLDHASIVDELENATRTVRLSNNLQFGEWRVDFLIDYIINVHHAYLSQVIPSTEARLASFVDGHKAKYPELPRIQEVFVQLAEVLLAHNRHEEEIIFPYIKQIDVAHRHKEPYGNLFVRTLRKPLSNVEKEHGQINDLLKALKQHTNNYIFPPNACTNHQVVYHKLKEIDDDFVQHTYLEHDILFPRAIEIEQQLLRV
jgi:regulator of cell morphogenesis and NO signaling